MVELRFVTTGNMLIQLQGMAFGRHLKDPRANVKSFIVDSHQLILNTHDMKDFTDWGVIELIDQAPGRGIMTVTIDSETLGWYGTAQVAVRSQGQTLINDNFQSGVRGPIGDPRRVKRYAIADF